jgi:prephenate dehydrogenase
VGILSTFITYEPTQFYILATHPDMTNIENNPIRVGIIGTGMVARGLALLISYRKDMVVSGILTRRKGMIADLGVSQDLVTLNSDLLFGKSDLIFVSTGDPIYSTDLIYKAFKYNLPVMTMDADTQVVSGSWLSQQGRLCESDGINQDAWQP